MLQHRTSQDTVWVFLYIKSLGCPPYEALSTFSLPPKSSSEPALCTFPSPFEHQFPEKIRSQGTRTSEQITCLPLLSAACMWGLLSQHIPEVTPHSSWTTISRWDPESTKSMVEPQPVLMTAPRAGREGLEDCQLYSTDMLLCVMLWCVGGKDRPRIQK